METIYKLTHDIVNHKLELHIYKKPDNKEIKPDKRNIWILSTDKLQSNYYTTDKNIVIEQIKLFIDNIRSM